MTSLRQLGAALLLVVLLPAIVVCLVVSRLFGFEWPADPDDLDGIACRRTWIEKRRERNDQRRTYRDAVG